MQTGLWRRSLSPSSVYLLLAGTGGKKEEEAVEKEEGEAGRGGEGGGEGAVGSGLV